MKEGPIGVRRYWTIGCLAIVLTMLCSSTVPDNAAAPLKWVSPIVEAVGCAILVLIARRRLGAKASLAFIGPVVGTVLVWAVYAWVLSTGPDALVNSALGPRLYIGITLLGLIMGSTLQFLIVGFVGQGGKVKKG